MTRQFMVRLTELLSSARGHHASSPKRQQLTGREEALQRHSFLVSLTTSQKVMTDVAEHFP
jgi:hypothetical protein